MVGSWLMEVAKGIGVFFLNPLFYWMILFVIIAGIVRIKKERINFGTRVFGLFAEWKNTWGTSLISGLVISIVVMGLGIVFSYETLLLLLVVLFLISLTFRFSLLSAIYTIGLTYILLLFSPYFIDENVTIGQELFTHSNMTGLALLSSLFLMAEAILILKTKPMDTMPNVVKGKRGDWIGQHHIKKLALVPFFALVPEGMITSIAPNWPLLSIGSETYGIILLPFIIGFNYKVITELPTIASKRIGKRIFFLAIVTIALAGASLYNGWFSLASVIVALLGKEWIMYKERLLNKHETPHFYHEKQGLKVLSVIPDTPADRLEIIVGETIRKVNNRKVNSREEFYNALQNSGSFFKLDVIDKDGEIRFIKSAFYEGEHHTLGLLFIAAPYFNK